MIIIKAANEAEVVGKIEAALSGEEIELIQDDEEEFTLEQAVGSVAYNALKVRHYLGRVERNTRKQEEAMRQLAEILSPIAVYAEYLLSQVDDEAFKTLEHVGVTPAQRLRNQRQRVEKLKQEGRYHVGSNLRREGKGE